MKVFADKALVWEGSAGTEVLTLNGPVGMRSDNARLQLELRAALPAETLAGTKPGCRATAEASE